MIKNIKKYIPNLYSGQYARYIVRRTARYKKWVFVVIGITFAVTIAGYLFVEYGDFFNSSSKYIYREPKLIEDYFTSKETDKKFKIDWDGRSEDEHRTTAQEYVQLETTEENLQRYYDVYKEPSVLHLRKALNGYLSGTTEGIETPEAVISKRINEEGILSGLDSFDKEYYKSKFIVYDIRKFLGDGDQITVIFQDKPNKMFQAWVYWNEKNPGYYDLRSFWQLPTPDSFMGELMENDLLKSAMWDKEHAL